MSTQKDRFDLFTRLQSLGFTYEESQALRRIEMTLRRWAERECGDGSDWAIERAEPRRLALWNYDNRPDCLRVVVLNYRGEVSETVKGLPAHIKDLGSPEAKWILARLQQREDETAGKPFNVYHGDGPRRRYAIADREAGALRRLSVILATRNARNPDADPLVHYHQGDPRGCSLYLLKRSDIRPGEEIDSIYNRGLAVCC